MMRLTAVLFLATIAQTTPAKPSAVSKLPVVTSVEPQGVRSGGSFVVQVDLQGSTLPFKIVVFRDDIDSFRKHASEPLTDNDAQDEARQTGLVKYRVKTDDSWLSRLNITGNANQEVRYRVALQAAVNIGTGNSLQSVKPGSKPAPAPMMQPTQFAELITVFARPEFNEELAVAGDIYGLLQLAVTLRLGVSDETMPAAYAWAGTDLYAMGTVDYSSGSLKKHDYVLSAWKLDKTPESEKSYSLVVDPKAWPELTEACASIDPTKCTAATRVPNAALQKQALQLENAVKQLEGILTPAQQKHYAAHLKLIKEQLSAVNNAIKSPTGK